MYRWTSANRSTFCTKVRLKAKTFSNNVNYKHFVMKFNLMNVSLRRFCFFFVYFSNWRKNVYSVQFIFQMKSIISLLSIRKYQSEHILSVNKSLFSMNLLTIIIWLSSNDWYIHSICFYSDVSHSECMVNTRMSSQ